jgi:hypothetical protein
MWVVLQYGAIAIFILAFWSLITQILVIPTLYSALFFLLFFLASWFCTWLVLAVIVGRLAAIRGGEKHYKREGNRISVGNFPGTVAMLVSLPLVYLLMTFETGFQPAFLFAPPKAAMEPLPTRIASLKNEALDIRRTLANIDSMTIAQIRSAFEKSLTLVEALHGESVNQHTQLEALRKELDAQRAGVAEVKATKESLEKLTKDQLALIESTLTQQAGRESEKMFWAGVIVSFPVGIVASLVAAWLLSPGKTHKIFKWLTIASRRRSKAAPETPH